MFAAVSRFVPTSGSFTDFLEIRRKLRMKISLGRVNDSYDAATVRLGNNGASLREYGMRLAFNRARDPRSERGYL
jgi:hypothetical protein